MASVTARKDKNGNVISYQIKVSRGRDPLTGKQLTPFTTTYTPPAGWSAKAIERDLDRFKGEFEAACKRGEVLTKAEVKAQAQANQAAAEAARLETEKHITFNRYVERYLTEIKLEGRANGTIAQYTMKLHHAALQFGEMRMEDIDRQMLAGYFVKLTTETSKTGKEYGQSSVNLHFNAVRALFSRAYRDEVIPVNPMERVRKPIIKRQAEGEKIFIDIAEIQSIISQVDAMDISLKWKLLIRLGIDSGLRCGELTGLRWEDIDLDAMKITVRNNVQYTAGFGLYNNPPKSCKVHDVFISEKSVSMLRQWKTMQAEKCLRLGFRHPYVFGHDNKPEPYRPKNIGYHVKKYLTAAGYEGGHTHTMRHMMISGLIQSGHDIVSVAARAGHSSIQTTLTHYAHTGEKAQKDMANTMDTVLVAK